MSPIQQMLLGLGAVLQKMRGDKGLFVGGFAGGFATSNITSSVSVQTISTGAASTNWGSIGANSFNGCSLSDGSNVYHHIGLRNPDWPPGAQYQAYMYYVKLVVATGSNAGDSGDLQNDGNRSRHECKGATNGNRGAFMGGTDYGSGSGFTGKKIDYFDFATLGNTTNFGNLLDQRTGCLASGNAGNKSRQLLYSGTTDTTIKRIEYINLDTTSDASDFGDYDYNPLGGNAYTEGRPENCMTSNDTRALFAGGKRSGDAITYIQYVTIDTTSNTSTFGDLLSGYYHATTLMGAYSNDDKAMFAGGERGTSSQISSGYSRTSVITIDTTGNASQKSNMYTGRCQGGSASGE